MDFATRLSVIGLRAHVHTSMTGLKIAYRLDRHGRNVYMMIGRGRT